MNKYILENYGGVIRRKFLNIKACRFMNRLPSRAVGTEDISAFKLNEFIKRLDLMILEVFSNLNESMKKEQIAAIPWCWIW